MNGDKISVNTGFTTYSQTGLEKIYNILLKLNWEHNIGKFTVTTNAGVDWFNQVSPTPSFKIAAKRPISISSKLGKSLLLSGELDYGPYNNTKTIATSQ